MVGPARTAAPTATDGPCLTVMEEAPYRLAA
jgi:hypothetical protein